MGIEGIPAVASNSNADNDDDTDDRRGWGKRTHYGAPETMHRENANGCDNVIKPSTNIFRDLGSGPLKEASSSPRQFLLQASAHQPPQ